MFLHAYVLVAMILISFWSKERLKSTGKKRRKRSNSVIVGSTETNAWEIVPIPNEEYFLCQNKLGMIHYTCKGKTKKCRLDGSQCFTWHHTRKGHIYFRETVCSDTGYNLGNSVIRGQVYNIMSAINGEGWQTKYRQPISTEKIWA